MAASGEAHPWDRSPVPAEHQIRGLGPITMSVPDSTPTDAVLDATVMDMREAPRLSSEGGARGACLRDGRGRTRGRASCRGRARICRRREQGAGGVHHVAFRTPDDETTTPGRERLSEMRMPYSGPVDRYYFKSLYFREPNGILFEIATDGPGFAADEPLETLGERLALPPFLEPRRAEIEAGLKPL